MTRVRGNEEGSRASRLHTPHSFVALYSGLMRCWILSLDTISGYSWRVDKFEFIAILVSIVFGVAITNLLSGMLRCYFKRELSNTRIAWSLAVGMVLVGNWWGFFRWSDNPEWTFLEFLFLMLWSTTHYLLAVSIYPYEFLDEYSEEMQRKFLLWAVLVMLMVDVAENAVRGDLLNPWYYLVFMGTAAAMAIAPLVWKSPKVMLAAGWLFFAALISWLTIVRGVLAS
jgi:hypothetical protein